MIDVGDHFVCIKDLIFPSRDRINGTPEIVYLANFIYVCDINGCITNETSNKYHSWEVEEVDMHFKRIVKGKLTDKKIYERIRR